MRNIAFFGKIRKWYIIRSVFPKNRKGIPFMNTRFFLFQMIINFYGLSTFYYLQCGSESGEIPIFYNISECSIFRSVFLKIDQRLQTNFDLQKFIISCYQTEDIRNVIKLPTFFVIGLKRCSK